MALNKVTSEDLLFMQDKDKHDPRFEHEAQIAMVQQFELLNERLNLLHGLIVEGQQRETHLHNSISSLISAVDRNTSAIYDTAKVQAKIAIAPEDNFVFTINKICEGLDPTSTTYGVLKRGLDKIEKARQS